MKTVMFFFPVWIFMSLSSVAFGQKEIRSSFDSTVSRQRFIVDSLRQELAKVKSSIEIIKAKVDSSKTVSEMDEHQLDELQESLSEIGGKLSAISDEAAEIAHEAARVYDVEKAVVQNGDYTLEEGQTVSGNIKVLNGDAYINGTLNGSLIVVNGDAHIGEKGRVSGNVVTINGRTRLKDGAHVDGSIIEQNGSRFVKTRKLTEKIRNIERSGLWDEPSFLFSRFAFNYNRVDGLFLGFGSKKGYFWSGAQSYSPYGFVGYAFGLHKWRYQLGLDKWFGNVDRFEVGIEGHSLTDSKDTWIIGPKENTAFSLVAREDYMDYFGRTGGSIHLAQYYRMESRIVLTFQVDRYDSVAKSTNWSIFGGEKSFRDNPAVPSGLMRSVVLEVDHRSKSGITSSRTGWKASLRGEVTVGGDFNFRMLSWNIARYQPLFKGAQFDFRFAGGTSGGVLPLERSFQLGGFNTLNAFGYKEYSGNRMLLLNLEVLLNPDLFNEFPFNLATLVLFSDIGQVVSTSPDNGMLEGWNAIKGNGFKSDLGVGIGDEDGSWRVFISWRTDVNTPPVFGVRLSRPF
ncbi:MAG: hypothetical protein ACP5MI_05305 [Candidatus Kryptoniota bacterium]